MRTKQETLRTIDPGQTGPPSGSGGWPAVAQEGVRQGGQLLTRATDRYLDTDRPPRPRASLAAVVALVLAILSLLGLVGGALLHQLGSSGYAEEIAKYRAEEAESRRQILEELRLHRLAIHSMVDEMALHHAGVERVSRQLERGTVRR